MRAKKEQERLFKEERKQQIAAELDEIKKEQRMEFLAEQKFKHETRFAKVEKKRRKKKKKAKRKLK